MSRAYKFLPVPRALYWVASEPTRRFFSVHYKFMLSFNPVLTEALYVSQSYSDAFNYLETLATMTPNSKKRQLLVKQVGVRHRHYSYDSAFAAALAVEETLSGDEFYADETAEDRVNVQIHQKPRGIVVAKWKGAVIR